MQFHREYEKIVVSDIKHPGLKNGLFDLVASFDLIEHIDNDQEAVKQLYRLCKPGGIVMLTVPAFRFLWGRQDIISHHKRRYTKREIKLLVRNCGLKILKISYFNTFLFPLVLLIRLLMRLKAKGTGDIQSDFGMFPSDLINRLCALIFSLESRLLASFDLPFGVSIVCIAKKQTG